jgi:four helix bundle protein
MKQKQNWKVFELAFRQQKLVFELTKSFPKEELYSLTSQIRRSSRSVYSALAEAYSKTMYQPHLLLKLSDADSENSETSGWMDIAVSCGYLTEEELAEIRQLNLQIGNLLNYMIHNVEEFRFR